MADFTEIAEPAAETTIESTAETTSETLGAEASSDNSNWMFQNLSTLRSRTLRQVCLPGSHDSGMSEHNESTSFSTVNNTTTQTKSIGQQLAAGVRWFDIRPFYNTETHSFHTAHMSEVGRLGWQGACGQSMADVISQLNDFTSASGDLVILSISHAYHGRLVETDFEIKKIASYGASDFKEDDWTLFYKYITTDNRINKLFFATGPPDLTNYKISDFIGNGSAKAPKVLVVMNFGRSKPAYQAAANGGFLCKGLYFKDNLKTYNDYSSTDDVDEMAADQLKKMRENTGPSLNNYFLLSWTLTLSDQGSIPIPLPSMDENIVELANKANAVLVKNCSPPSAPITIPTSSASTTSPATLISCPSPCRSMCFPFRQRPKWQPWFARA